MQDNHGGYHDTLEEILSVAWGYSVQHIFHIQYHGKV